MQKMLKTAIMKKQWLPGVGSHYWCEPRKLLAVSANVVLFYFFYLTISLRVVPSLYITILKPRAGLESKRP